jgi:adenylate kinase family enzyme
MSLKRIEVIGPPGSGKSTLLPYIKKLWPNNNRRMDDRADCLTKFYINCKKNKLHVLKYMPRFLAKSIAIRKFRNQRQLAELALRFIAQNIAFSEMVISSQKQRQLPKTEIEKLIEWFFNKIGYEQLYQEINDKSDFVLIDEGLLQYGLSLVVSEAEIFDEKLLTNYLQFLSQPEIIIFIDADTEVCTQRSKINKVRFRFQNKSEKQISAFIDHARIACQQVLNFYSARPYPPVIIRLDNTCEIDQTAAELRRQLNLYGGNNQ